jgi:2-polyprenyl-6-hydroxyphenyl methylase/3-demethylubiquinone-9 3-methyltransferase
MPNEAVDYHSQRVQKFAAEYSESEAFKQRFRVWERLIAAYGSASVEAIDVGCGVGTLTHVAAAACRSALGVDGSTAMIAAARRHAAPYDNIRFEVGLLEDLDEHPAAGLVLCSSVLEYVEDFSGAVAVLAGLTEAGGHLIVSVPNASSFYRMFERTTYRLTKRPAYVQHLRHLRTLEAMRLEAESNGLTLIHAQYYGRARSLLCCVMRRS